MSRPWTDRRVVAAGGAAAAAVLIGAGLYGILRPTPRQQDPVIETPPERTGASQGSEVELYFPGQDGRLHAERHELQDATEPSKTIARLVESLLAGPRDASLAAPLPEGVSLGRAYLMDDATVILDLTSPDGTKPATGSFGEMLMLYSIVNSVLLNVEEAERLVLLWDGQQPNTFAGHLDTTRPLTPKVELIVARNGSPSGSS